jgi:hypothetical protein
MLRLLIDTSVWLDMATRRDGQKWIVPLRVLKFQGRLELLVPTLVIEEFERNRPRLEAAVTSSVLDRLRQLRRELREFAGDQGQNAWLEETRQHIPLVNAMAPQNFREIAELLRSGKTLKPTSTHYAKVVQRGLDKKAPFSSDKNSVADALLIELYSSQLKQAKVEDVYCFATSNHRDFSTPNGDHRQPHADLADLFSDPRSHYVYQVEGLHEMLIAHFGDEFLEEHEEVGLIIAEDEPRTLAEIAEAEAEFFEKVAYVRFVVRAEKTAAEYPEDTREQKFWEIVETRADIESKYGHDELWEAIGPGVDEAWKYGYLSGKLATLRWVLGSEWDFLDI